MEINLREANLFQIAEGISRGDGITYLIGEGAGNELLKWKLMGKIYPLGDLEDEECPLVLKVKDSKDRICALKLFKFREKDYEHLTDDFTTAARFSGFKYIVLNYQAKLYENNNLAYILMEYFETDLEKALYKNVLTPADKIEITMKISEALKYIHENEAIHNDIKPGNIFLKKEKNNWVPVIGDFGRYKIGTALFSHPQKLERLESIREGKPQPLADMQKWDLFSMGLVFYFIMMGRLPESWDLYISKYLKANKIFGYMLKEEELEVFRQVLLGIFKKARIDSPKSASWEMALLVRELLTYEC